MKNKKLSTANINLWQEAFISSISTVIGFSLSIVTVIIITRFLSVSDVGLYFFYLALIYIGIQIPKGIGTALTKRVSSIDDSEERKKYLSISIIISFISICIISILSLSLFNINNYISINISWHGVLAVNYSIFGYTILKIGKSYLSGIGKPGLADGIKNYIGNGLKLLFIFIGVYFIDATYYVALFMYSNGYLIAGIICFYLSINSLNLQRPTKSNIIKLLSFAIWSIPNTFVNDMYTRLNTILLGSFIGSVAVSYYDVSERISYITSFIGVGISSAAYVKISGMYESKLDVTDISSKVISASTLFAYPLLIIVLIYSESLLGFIFGSDYTTAKYFLIGLTLQQLIHCYVFIQESILNALDKPKRILFPSTLSLLLNVTIAIPLILYIGPLGVIISTISSDIVRVIYLQYNVRKELHDLKIHKFNYIQFIVFAGLLIIFYTFNSLFIINNIVYILIISTCIVIAYYTILYIISPLFKDIINNIKLSKIM